ncbi:MAG TPA: hypothetical protein VGF28_12160 [Thermoanaerobaculia bacterium]
MKMTASVSRFLVLGVCLVLAVSAGAQSSGPSANGDFAFATGGLAWAIQFNARIQNKGVTEGQITIVGSLDVPDQDVDGEGNGGSGGVAQVSLIVTVDCLRISGKRAAIGGSVTDSSNGNYIGRRGLLVIEDNGEGSKAPALDRFTWGLYGNEGIEWVATDAELESDIGAGLTWFATDAERNDDVGRPSHASTEITCESFSLAAYDADTDLQNIPHGSGNLQVKP